MPDLRFLVFDYRCEDVKATARNILFSLLPILVDADWPQISKPKEALLND